MLIEDKQTKLIISITMGTKYLTQIDKWQIMRMIRVVQHNNLHSIIIKLLSQIM